MKVAVPSRQHTNKTATFRMPPRKRAARMQAHRSPSPPASPQVVKSKATGKKRKLSNEKKIIPWRKWIKYGDIPSKYIHTYGLFQATTDNNIVSRITGKPLERGGDVAEIATEPFNPLFDFEVHPYGLVSCTCLSSHFILRQC